MMFDALFWLAINAYHEARGESDLGVKAVCHVVLNRARAQKKAVKDVVLQPMQFSWANGGARPAIKEYDSFQRCLTLASQAIGEDEAGQDMGGIDHYYADYIQAPPWAKNMKTVQKIGTHIFMRGA